MVPGRDQRSRSLRSPSIRPELRRNLLSNLSPERNEIDQGSRAVRGSLQEPPPRMQRLFPLPPSLRLRKSSGPGKSVGMVPVLPSREEIPEKDGRREVTFNEARSLVEEIWATLSKSEQHRMLDLWTNPRHEPLPSSFTPRRGGSNGPSGPSKDQKFTSAVSGKRV